MTSNAVDKKEGGVRDDKAWRHPAGTRIWQRVALAGLRGIARRTQSMPRGRALRHGERLGLFAYRIAGRQRRFAHRNLILAFNDTLSEAERDTLIRGVFVHYGKMLVDFVRGPVHGPADVRDLVASVEGWEPALAAQAAGRGVLIQTAHLGNWEFLGRWLAAQGLNLTVVAREPEDPLFGGYIRSLRENAGFGVKNKGGSARDLIAALRRGEAVGILPDQNSGDVFVPYFGVPAGTVAGPASFAMHTGALLLPSYCIRDADDRYRMIFLPPIEAVSTKNKDADVARIMTEVNRCLESVVREYPDQWLWIHNRWKSAFEERNRDRWPEGADYAAARSLWDRGSG